MKTRDYYVPDTFNQLPDCVSSLDSKTKVKKWIPAYMSDAMLKYFFLGGKLGGGGGVKRQALNEP